MSDKKLCIYCPDEKRHLSDKVNYGIDANESNNVPQFTKSNSVSQKTRLPSPSETEKVTSLTCALAGKARL